LPLSTLTQAGVPLLFCEKCGSPEVKHTTTLLRILNAVLVALVLVFKARLLCAAGFAQNRLQGLGVWLLLVWLLGCPAPRLQRLSVVWLLLPSVVRHGHARLTVGVPHPLSRSRA
jgi:hypothetical protein